jgi:hypothetical protein
MGRLLDNWLSSFLDFTDRTEPPQSYLLWCGIATIAAVLERRVYLRWGTITIYPNLYTVLVGPSGMCRKGTAIGIGKELMEKVGINMGSESITKEALYNKLDGVTAPFDDVSKGKPSYQSALTIISPELSVFLGEKDAKFLATLTDLYDCADKWIYETKGRGKNEITGVCLNIIGATAPDWLPMILPMEAVGGGFTSRVIWVCEDKKRQTVVDPRRTETEILLQEKLIHDLGQIKLLCGEVFLTEEMIKEYTDWYIVEDQKTYRANDPMLGYRSRKPTLVKKLSIICSVARSDDLIVTRGDFQKALKIMEYTEDKMNVRFGTSGKSRFAEETLIVHNYLINNRTADRDDLLKAFYLDLDPYTLDRAIESLEHMKEVKTHIGMDGRKTTYTYIGKATNASKAYHHESEVGGTTGKADAEGIIKGEEE